MSKQIETQLEVQLENRDRISVFFRAILVIPAWIFLTSFSQWSSEETKRNDWSMDAKWTTMFLVLPVVLTLLFRGKYPSYVLSFNKSLLELSLRVVSFIALLTDKYPSIEQNEVAKTTFPEIDGGAKLNRLLPLVKWLLAIPLYFVGFLYSLYALIFVIISWFNILLTGRMSSQAADVICKVIAFWNRVTGYALLLVTDEYPSFSL